MSFFKKFVTAAKNIASSATKKTNGTSSAGYNTYISRNNNSFKYTETKNYLYTGAKNTEENTILIDEYDRQQLNRIIVYGGQRNILLTQIEGMVTRE